jgi:hypothetical protein
MAIDNLPKEGCPSRNSVSIKPSKPVERENKRLHVALPVKITYWDKDKKPTLEMACTYDISSTGARITSLRCLRQRGEIVTVERGRNKSFCRVVWVGDPNSELRGQIGLQSVDSSTSMFETELQDVQNAFEPIAEEEVAKPKTKRGENRRRQTRFPVEGVAEIEKPAAGKPVSGSIKDLSELGCLVQTKEVMIPGTDVKLVLKIANTDLTLKGKVRHSLEMGVGIEFSAIRKGDRQTLKHLLKKLAEQHGESIEVDVR